MKNILEIGVLQSSKKLILLLTALLFFLNSTACEICGCSINGYHYGILPQFTKNFVGLKYSYRSFQSQHLISEQLYILGHTSTEYYNAAELWGRFYVNKKIQLYAFVPFNHYLTNEQGAKTIAKGMGDITIAANYTLYNNATNPIKNFKQTLLVGGGVKLPTGKFNTSKLGAALNPSINTGTGSIDYLTNIIYTCRFKKVGLNADANYRINSTNKNDFIYGNRFTTAAKFFYWKNMGKKTTLLPNAGIMYEHAAKDKHYAEIQNFSGGNITYLTAGIEAYIGKINIGTTYNKPLSQNMSQGLVQTKSHLSVNVGIMF
jgi:hypothetical protein